MKSHNQVAQSFCWKTFQQLSLVFGNSAFIHLFRSQLMMNLSSLRSYQSMRFQTIGLHDQLWSSSTHRLPWPCAVIPESKWFTAVITWNKWIINPWDHWHRVSEAAIIQAGDDVTKRQEFQWNVQVKQGEMGILNSLSVHLFPASWAATAWFCNAVVNDRLIYCSMLCVHCGHGRAFTGRGGKKKRMKKTRLALRLIAHHAVSSWLHD